MKKIPYALTLLVAYVIMTYKNFSTAFGEGGNLATVVIALAPVVLAVLLIVNMKKDVSQIAAIVCLAFGACQLYNACTLFASMMEAVRMGAEENHILTITLPSLANSAFGGLLTWFVGAHIQDGETTGNYKMLACIAFLAQLLFSVIIIGSGYGNLPFSVLANLIVILIYWHLPHAFVKITTAKKTKVSQLVVLVIFVGAYIFGQDAIMKMAMGY